MALNAIIPYFDLFTVILWLIFRTWWWVLIPWFLYYPSRGLYLYWVRWEVEYAAIDWTVLELIPPAEVEKPFRAMEDIYTVLWSLYDNGNWRETWCQGELPVAPYWISFEITSKAGEIHFYIRTMKGTEKFVEGIIHAHYPDAELFEVEDYVKNVPQDIPNETYDLYMEVLKSVKNNALPIRTYEFFEIKPEEIEQRKKVDPMFRLLEDMAKLKEGEELWFQIVVSPIGDVDNKWITKGRALADELSKRPGKPDRISMIAEALRYLFFIKPPYSEEKKEESVIPVEMRLTPGERAVVEGVENKISKKGFSVFSRAFYIYKPEAYVSPNKRIPRSYFGHFSTENMNYIRDWSPTKTRIHYFFRDRRLYARKKKAFKKYINRFAPRFPDWIGEGTMVLNSEELASIFHLPMKASDLPPGVPRIAAKKGGPPPNIPTE